eukprot:TRINITY_DN3814_c0_g1_i2.p1 TRINITY_DN3814_c0_g1~~TRINITY_DN3814_c0_g1_i2.p1  ORF type:complete len:247 (-),score=33.73 TRINITY_DN3814_c0_g1_i2:207-947(-)
MGCGASTKKPSPPAAEKSGEGCEKVDRKLNVLCLHGTTMSGASMQGMFKWKECGIEPFCQDIAIFYYPTGPCVVAANHAIWKAAPEAGPPGPDKRHWWTMKNKWDFGDKNFADAEKTLKEFVDTEIQAPVDVILGYSQGAAAASKVLNDVKSGKWKQENMNSIKGAIFHGCPEHPKILPSVGKTVKSLHCNGRTDPLTSLAGAKKHASAFKDSTIFEFDGGHEVRKNQQEPVRKFLLMIKEGRARE